MCLILLAYKIHPRYDWVVAANRDEFYERPTAPMRFWDERPDLLAGRDLAQGGTWMGVTRGGRFAAITNYRDPQSFRPDAPSRGYLVGDFLEGQTPSLEYLEKLAPRAQDYNGFSLLVGDGRELGYFSNHGGPPRVLEPGIYGLSNHLLNTPWPKVRKGTEALRKLLKAPGGLTPAVVLELLEDRSCPPDELLPETGVGIGRERLYASLFVKSRDYGTRSSTVLLAQRDGAVHITEKSHDDGSLRQFFLRWPDREGGPLMQREGFSIEG